MNNSIKPIKKKDNQDILKENANIVATTIEDTKNVLLLVKFCDMC